MTRIVLFGAAALLGLTGVALGEDLEPVDQAALNALQRDNGAVAAFEHAFEAGDELTEVDFLASQGVGAHVGEGRRFTRFPRADLTAPTEWSSHFPRREGGPNATSCISCHNAPAANGAGGVALNAVIDPTHTGDPSLFLERNTTHLFALSIPQKIAEEMSLALFAQRESARMRACATGAASTSLIAKGVSFGQVSVTRIQPRPCVVTFDWRALEGISEDLVVRAFGWKGNHATIRAFTRDAAHNELGMQAVELVGSEDGDHDGITNELSVGDLTALTIYMAGLERPVSTLELADLSLLEMTAEERARINAGERRFADVGCADCHIPEMTIEDPMFREPSRTPGFYDVTFPSGDMPSAHSLSQKLALMLDMTADQPNNRIETDRGVVRLGSLPAKQGGGAVARWYTDFKRHEMGPILADPMDPFGIGASVWPTRSLAGVGSTAPWLHDGRATTLDEAIIAHGGEAAASRDAYAALIATEKAEIITFLESLVIYTEGEDDSH